MGAIASGGVRIMNDDVVRWYDISDRAIEAVAQAEQRELERREHEYRQGRALSDLRNRIVILVDDGLATGSTMRSGSPGRQTASAGSCGGGRTRRRAVNVRGIRRRHRRNGMRSHPRAVLGRGTVVSRFLSDKR